MNVNEIKAFSSTMYDLTCEIARLERVVDDFQSNLDQALKENMELKEEIRLLKFNSSDGNEDLSDLDTLLDGIDIRD